MMMRWAGWCSAYDDEVGRVVYDVVGRVVFCI